MNRDDNRESINGNVFAIDIFGSETPDRTLQFVDALVFSLGMEEYGIDLRKVTALHSYTSMRCSSHLPSYYAGQIRMHGVPIPVIDIRHRFHVPVPAYDQLTVVLVLAIGDSRIGMVADAVSDIHKFNIEDVNPPPRFDAIFDTDCIVGVTRLHEKRLVLLDIDRVIGAERLPQARQPEATWMADEVIAA